MYNPYMHQDENRLTMASQAITLLALIVGGLIRATQAEGGALMKSGNINMVMTGAYLVTSGVLLYCMALISFILYRYYQNHADESSDGNDGAVLSGKSAGQLELVVFSSADANASEEVLYTEVDVGTSK